MRKKAVIEIVRADHRVLTLKMTENAKGAPADRQKSISLLEQAGILDENEHLAKDDFNQETPDQLDVSQSPSAHDESCGHAEESFFGVLSRRPS